MRSSGTPPWLFFLGMALVSVAAYYLSVLGGLFFLLPLEAVRRRQGVRAFGLVIAASLVGIVGVAGLLRVSTHQPWTLLDTVLVSPAFVFAVGWIGIVALERQGWRALYRVTAMTAITGVVVFPVLAWLFQSAAFNREVQSAFLGVWKEVFQSPGLNVPGLMGQMDPQQFFDLLKTGFLGSFLLVIFLFWSLTWRVAKVFSPGQTVWGARSFVVPPAGSAVFLAVWGVLLVLALISRWGAEQDWGYVGYALINVGAIALVVHLWAGWGIALSLIDRWNVPRIIRALTRMLIVLLAILPGTTQIVVIVGLAGLAVLELWVSFRNRREEVEL